MHISKAELEVGLNQVALSPKEVGTVELIISRPSTGERQMLEQGTLCLEEGLMSDNWKTRGSQQTADGKAHPDRQLTIMNSRFISIIARQRERWSLAGDQLYNDMDLSVHNLPLGTRLKIGSAVVQVTAEPHRGCQKFLERFGKEAMMLVNSDRGKELNLRGINAKVIQAGIFRVHDPVTKLPANSVSPLSGFILILRHSYPVNRQRDGLKFFFDKPVDD